MLVLMIALLAPAHAATLGAIDGLVQDSATAAPVTDALVSASSPYFQRSSKTDQAGRFSFSGLSTGTCTIVISKAGYEKASIEVAVVGDRAAIGVMVVLRPTLRFINVTMRDWPTLFFNPHAADVYVPPWGHAEVNVFNSAFRLLPFVPGLTFGGAPRMMR